MSNPIYIVKKGDTYWHIAKIELGDANRYGEIARLNPEVDPKHLKPGQRLKLPSDAKMAQPPARVYGPLRYQTPLTEEKEFKPLEKTFGPFLWDNSSSTTIIAKCEQNIPCCLDLITLKCSHGQILELPVKPKQKAVLTLVADLGEKFDASGRCVDSVELKIVKRNCSQGRKNDSGKMYPIVNLTDEINKKSEALIKSSKIRLVSPEIKLLDSLEYFLDNFLFLDKSKSLASKYSVSAQLCKGDTSKFTADIYVYPKVKWDGSLSFGYGLDSVEFNRSLRRQYSREKNKTLPNSADRIKTANIPKSAKSHTFSVEASMTLFIGNKVHTLSLPYDKALTRQSGWGGKFIGGLDTVMTAKDKIGNLMKADPDSWMRDLSMIGPNFSISGNEALSESSGLDKPLHEANIEFNALIGLKGEFELLDAALEGLKKAPHPVVRGLAIGLDKGKDALRDGSLYSETWDAGIKADIGIKLILSFTIGGRSSGNSDNDAMAIFTKPSGGEWGFKEGSLALEFGVEIKAFATATVGYVATVGNYAIEGGGIAKMSLQLKVEAGSGGGKACKLYFHFNGLKLYYQIITEHPSSKEGNENTRDVRGRKLQEAMEGGSSNGLSANTNTREEVQLIDPFRYPDNGLHIFSFGGRGNA